MVRIIRVTRLNRVADILGANADGTTPSSSRGVGVFVFEGDVVAACIRVEEANSSESAVEIRSAREAVDSYSAPGGPEKFEDVVGSRWQCRRIEGAEDVARIAVEDVVFIEGTSDVGGRRCIPLVGHVDGAGSSAAAVGESRRERGRRNEARDEVAAMKMRRDVVALVIPREWVGDPRGGTTRHGSQAEVVAEKEEGRAPSDEAGELVSGDGGLRDREFTKWARAKDNPEAP